MPAFEIHADSYFAEADAVEVIEAATPYEAAIEWAARRYSPCRIRRTNSDGQGDTFVIHDAGPGAYDVDGRGIEVEVFEHDPDFGRV